MLELFCRYLTQEQLPESNMQLLKCLRLPTVHTRFRENFTLALPLVWWCEWTDFRVNPGPQLMRVKLLYKAWLPASCRKTIINPVVQPQFPAQPAALLYSMLAGTVMCELRQEPKPCVGFLLLPALWEGCWTLTLEGDELPTIFLAQLTAMQSWIFFWVVFMWTI